MQILNVTTYDHSSIKNLFIRSLIHLLTHSLIHPIIYSKSHKLILRSINYLYPKTWTLNTSVPNKILLYELNSCVFNGSILLSRKYLRITTCTVLIRQLPQTYLKYEIKNWISDINFWNKGKKIRILVFKNTAGWLN